MQMQALCAALIGGALFVAGIAQAAKPKDTPTAAQLVQLDFKATVQADGTLTDIQPDEALPEALQAMIHHRVATWHYRPQQWQGKSQPVTISQTIKARVVPTVQGGFALRIADVTGQVRFIGPPPADQREGMPWPPPKFPPELMARGINAVLVYAVLYDEAGKAQQVDLIHPSDPDRDYRRLDKSAREAMAQWVRPHKFEGTPIACRAKVPITFITDDSPEQTRVPPEVAAFFDKYTDMCPAVELETPVADTFL